MATSGRPLVSLHNSASVEPVACPSRRDQRNPDARATMLEVAVGYEKLAEYIPRILNLPAEPP